LKQFVRSKLRRAIEVERARSLVRRERDNLLHTRIDRCLNDVLRADDVGLHVLERVVLGSVDLLESCSMHHVIDAMHGPCKTVLIADVADEPSEARVVGELLTNLVLLQLVAREDHNTSRVVAFKQLCDEGLTERSGTARYEDR